MRWALTTLLFMAALAGCASAPSYPDPQPGSGQILVTLNGQAREGVKGPAREDEHGEYSITRTSVEKGRDFERVNYKAISDVVVIVPEAAMTTRGLASSVELVVDEAGFSRSQLVMSPGTELTVRNRRDTALTVLGFSGADFFELTVKPGASASTRVAAAGTYEIACDEDESLAGTLFVTGSMYWSGTSDEGAFFDALPPGEYTVEVYAPRLPSSTRRLTVSGGKRQTVAVDLTVNDLPKARR
ncbi:MAG: hypothetical protein IT464_07120 [Planctomycetes bacterium]|nr:hypothetical protein [Planctomycetota bacterium]